MENATYGLNAIKSNNINADATPLTFKYIEGLSSTADTDRTLLTLSNALIYGIDVYTYSDADRSSNVDVKLIINGTTLSYRNYRDNTVYLNLDVTIQKYLFNISSSQYFSLLNNPIYARDLSFIVNSSVITSNYVKAGIYIAYKQL